MFLLGIVAHATRILYFYSRSDIPVLIFPQVWIPRDQSASASARSTECRVAHTVFVQPSSTAVGIAARLVLILSCILVFVFVFVRSVTALCFVRGGSICFIFGTGALSARGSGDAVLTVVRVHALALARILRRVNLCIVAYMYVNEENGLQMCGNSKMC